MDQTTWIVLGIVAVGVFGFVVRGGLRGRMDPELGAVSSFIAMILWAVWSFAAIGGVSQTSECCTVIEHYPELGYLGIAFSLAMVASGFKASFEVLNT